MNGRRLFLAAMLLAVAGSALAGTGRIVIINRDSPGEGFNDPTPAQPVGGNPGTTIGQQRLNVFQRAADRWSTTLDTNVDILVRATFSNLPCTATQVVLGQAVTGGWEINFPNAPKQNVFYPNALANKLAGTDLSPNEDDIITQFNAALDNPTCSGEAGWYYGFDGNEGEDTALYPVVLHEIGHGLGMTSGGFPEFNGFPTVYATHILDVTAGRRWDQMTTQERQISMTNTGNVVWDGANVTEWAKRMLDPVIVFTLTGSSGRSFEIGTAAFGPPISVTPMSGGVVAMTDEANAEGPSTTDGCTAYMNGDAVRGKIALVDRGTCTFVQKALNAQAAGAVGLIIIDNQRTRCIPPGLGGSNDEVRIPAVSITQDDGAALRAQLASGDVSGMLMRDPVRRAGTSTQGYVRLYAPCTLEGGSSISHWDVGATPNLLMEPAINSDLLDTVDLSLYQMIDIGWTAPPRTGRRILRKSK